MNGQIAPRAPMRHVMILGWIGLAASSAGVAAALVRDLGPVWYPLLLALATVPCCRLGGRIHARRLHARRIAE